MLFFCSEEGDLEVLSLDGGQMAGFGSLGFPLKITGNPGGFQACSVGTQWETRGKNRRQGLGRKRFPQKKVLSLVLCVAMLLSVMVMGTGAASFTDQDEFSDNYAEAAEVLTGMGIIQGYDDGSFLPQRNINRAQVATMIYRALPATSPTARSASLLARICSMTSTLTTGSPAMSTTAATPSTSRASPLTPLVPISR